MHLETIISGIAFVASIIGIFKFLFDLKKEMTVIKDEVHNTRDELRKEMADSREESRKEIAEIRKEMYDSREEARKEIAEIRRELYISRDESRKEMANMNDKINIVSIEIIKLHHRFDIIDNRHNALETRFTDFKIDMNSALDSTVKPKTINT